MSLIEIIEESFLVLRTNKMRTALSALGIIIGIASVITLMTLGQASQQSIQNRIQSLGSNLLTIRPGTQQQGGIRLSSSNTSLKYSDAQAIIESPRINTVANVAAEYSDRSQVTFDRNNTNTTVYGITSNYMELRNIQVEVGNTISQEDIDNLGKVAIVGPTVVEDLFTQVNPLGQSIKINSTSFTIIGVTKTKGSGGSGNPDDAVYIPLTTAQKILFGADNVTAIYAQAKNTQVMEAAQNQIGFLLLELHKIATPGEADFTVQSQEDLLETVNEVTGTFTALLTGIAAISLIVGGIGIMNIMLVTVTERTTEIGLRKALGAKQKAIIAQFLVESIILTITGGLIGVAIGIGLSQLLIKVLSLPAYLSLPSIALSVIVSCAIGIIFGWYPAHKASKLQPIEALRYE